jgi:predicted DNA-binding protein with PD1-like motif
MNETKRYAVSIKNHEEIVNVLTQFCKDKKIKGGQIIGIGAVKSATLRFFNPSTKQYVDKTFDEQMEIANLTGNISLMNGDVYLHLHATFGREDYTAIAGHLLKATLNGAGEFIVTNYSLTLPRVKDSNLGLNVFDF